MSGLKCFTRQYFRLIKCSIQLQDQVLLNHVSEQLNSMSNNQDCKDLDPEGFYRLLLIIRNMAVSRPANLTKFAAALGNY